MEKQTFSDSFSNFLPIDTASYSRRLDSITTGARNSNLANLLSKTKLNSVALVRERTIPTERPPPVGEGSASVV